MSRALEKRQFHTENRPPEGGWGYLVGIGLAVPIACALGSLSSFGLMFNDFITGVGGGTSAVTIINGVFFSAVSFAGMFASSLFKKFSMRSVGLFGGCIYFFGSIMTTFVTSVEHLMVSFGVLQGAGFGFMVPVFFTTFNQYFVRKRVFMMSLAQTLIGIGTMIYPMMVHLLMNTYGFRGAMAVIGAINAHAIFGMVVMHPVEWHFKVVEIPVEDAKPLMDVNGNPNGDVKSNENGIENCDGKIVETRNEKCVESDDENIVEKDDTNGAEKCDKKDDNDDANTKDENIEALSGDEFELTHLPSYAKKRPRFSIPNEESFQLMKYKRSKSLVASQDLDGFDPVRRRISSIMSLGQYGAAIYSNESLASVKYGKWQKVIDYLDLTLLKDLVYLNIVFGLSFALYADNSFFTLQPMYLFELGFSKADTAMIVATGAAADMISRMSLAVVSYFIELKARYVYLAGVIGHIIFRFVFLHVYSFTGMLIVTAILGYLRTLLHTPLSLVFAEYLPLKRFASGYALFMLFQGNLAFLIGPFIGWIRDVTQDYVICFHSLTFILALCAVPWIIEIIWLRIYPRKTETDKK